MSDVARDPNDEPHGWVEIDLQHLRPPSGRELPFQVFANRLKSSTKESDDFIFDPLASMKDAPGELTRMNVAGFRGDDLSLDIEALRGRWHLTTYVANHHRGLRRIYHYAMLTVGRDGLHLMIYKDFDDSE